MRAHFVKVRAGGSGLYFESAETLVAEPAAGMRIADVAVESKLAKLALVAVGALFRVKIFGRHAEHVVTLYANTV
jgi:hypothetical protein